MLWELHSQAESLLWEQECTYTHLDGTGQSLRVTLMQSREGVSMRSLRLLLP